MSPLPRIRTIAVLFLPALFLFSCNLTIASPARSPVPATQEAAAASPAAVSPTPNAAAPSCSSPGDGGLRLCFVGLADGQILAAVPGEPIHLAAEASGAIVVGISLNVNEGETIAFKENTGGTDPFQAEFLWTPVLGSATYRLRLEAMNADKSASTAVVISVTVTGLPSISPTPSLAPGEVYPEIKTKILATYRQTFGLTLTSPVIARKFRTSVEDPWVSAAYIGNVYYEVEAFPDGHVEAWTTPLFPNTDVDIKNSLFKDPLCRPAGRYSMLVVFLDFGNLHVGADEVLADLAAATEATNLDYAAYPTAGSGTDPILQIQTTGVVIPVPAEVAGKMITPAQIRQYAGIDPAPFRWIAQVDLDSASTTRFANGGKPENTSFGYAMTGCPAVQTMVNIQITIDAKEELTGDYGRLADTMLAHEVFHLFGYPGSHSWPCISGPQIDPTDSCGNKTIPALMLGWVDVDGDNIPEIMDPTPYGITLP